MTPEEMKQKLKEMGIDVDSKTGQWTQKPEGIDASQFPTVQAFIQVGEQMKILLEKQIEKDQATLEVLHERLKRFEHGGGQ